MNIIMAQTAGSAISDGGKEGDWMTGSDRLWYASAPRVSGRPMANDISLERS
jgi:hypothetical protein